MSLLTNMKWDLTKSWAMIDRCQILGFDVIIYFFHARWFNLGLEFQKDSNQWVCARVHKIYYSWQSSRQNYSKNNLKCIWSYTRRFNNLYYTLLAKSCVYFVTAKTRWKVASMEIQDTFLKVSVFAFQFGNFPSSFPFD